MLWFSYTNIALTLEGFHVTLKVGETIVVSGLWQEVQDAPELRRLATSNKDVGRIVEIIDAAFRDLCD